MTDWCVCIYVLPDTGTLCGGSTLVPVHRCECHCFPHSGTKSDKCILMCFLISFCSSLENTNKRQKWQNKYKTKYWQRKRYLKPNWLLLLFFNGLACEVYLGWRRLPLVHCHSHTGHFFSSSYTHIHACGWYLCPPQPPLVPVTGTGTCCPDFPSLRFWRDITQAKQSSVGDYDFFCIVIKKLESFRFL